jgi:hypothetical protein
MLLCCCCSRRRVQEVSRHFSFFKTPTRTLKPIQPPKRWVTASFSRPNPLRRDVEHSPPATAEVKNEWTFTSVAPTDQTFMVCTETNSPLYLLY